MNMRKAGIVTRLMNFMAAGGDTISPQNVLILLAIASRPGITQRELESRFDMPRSSVSRTLDALGEEGTRQGKPGLELIQRKRGTGAGGDRRSNGLFLTPRGRAFLHSMVDLIPDNDNDVNSERMEA